SIPGGGTEFTLVIAEKELDAQTGTCEPAYGAPNTGGCYLYETFPGGVTFQFENGDPAGIAGVCPASGATDAYVLAKSDDGVTTFPPAPPQGTNPIVNCDSDLIGQLPWGLRHLARLILPTPLHARDEGEMGMVGSFSTIFWAMPVALESFGTIPTGPVAPGQALQLSFRAVQTHVDHDSEDDHSAPGVQVDFSLLSGAGSLSATSAVTNADGVVTVGWTLPLTEGNYSLTAAVAGVTADVEAGTAANVDVAVQTGSAVSGTVFYSTTPLAGVTVELVEGAATNQALQTATTDASGNYSFTDVPDGTYHVKAYGSTTEFITWKASQVTVAGENVSRNIDLPKIIVLLTPASGSTVFTSQPELTWTANPEAVRYTVQINVTDGWELIDHPLNITSASYTVIPQLEWGVTHTWQVDAYDQAGHHVGTTQSAFTLTPTQPIG
ncbi:MAG: carboxypeptidase regulatory-like domain-containing protein, partial [Gemmatimonadetes bacterium]|nr:carboxypeptidase regulatory-like domain-containing protein [Gemmatimonadota bacterium]